MNKVYKTLPRVSAHIANDVEWISKDKVTVEGGAFASGTVLGLLANGNYTKLDITEGATEAHEAELILYGHIDATEAPTNAMAHARVSAVYQDRLTWPDGISEDKKAAAIAKLKLANIIMR